MEYKEAKCDKYDYLVSAASGIIAGAIDILFVGMPGKSLLGNFTDTQTDNLVKKFAKMVGWNPRLGNEDNIASAIGFLEKKFPVNYDQAHSGAVEQAFQMNTKNHHYKSLSHSPDIVGLFFSVLDQFQGKSTFISNGNLIRIDTSSQNLNLYGSILPAKLFCGFYNWLGHIMSDLAGSSGGRGSLLGRGSGLSIPFMELFQVCNFGELNVYNNRKTLANVMIAVFENGYDARYGMAMAIPVFLNELIIRVFWVIKRHFYKKIPWKECVPSLKYDDLRFMLIIGNGALCLIDGIDAAIRSKGDALIFILRINLIAWIRFVILIFKELSKKFGASIINTLKIFVKDMEFGLSLNEKALIDNYYTRIQKLDENLDYLLQQYITMINNEYLTIQKHLNNVVNYDISSSERAEHSILLAKACKVNNSDIIKSEKDLDDFFLN